MYYAGNKYTGDWLSGGGLSVLGSVGFGFFFFLLLVIFGSNNIQITSGTVLV